ncbi:protein phosphatase regulator SHP1 [Sporobolomyces koalae]|uniref:protein phosphatase regulator SHP1 n=1 Tax=Sporobolomyces koalae TaxID=500713 RepID=UPI00316C6A34
MSYLHLVTSSLTLSPYQPYHEEQLTQIVSVTGCTRDQAQFYLDSANGDVSMAVATYYENAGQEAQHHSAEVPTTHASEPSQSSARPEPQTQRVGGGQTLSGAPAEPLPAGWGSGSSSSNNSRPQSRTRNPMRSNAGPRITGFRDLASSSAGPTPSGGDSDDDESRDPTNFYTGGAKSGLSVENPDEQRRSGGAHGDMIKNILQQAKEGASRALGGFGGGAAASTSSSSSAFTGNAHTLGSDETPSSFIPDPSKDTEEDEEPQDEEEEEVVTRNLTFWQDGFSVEDGDLLKYEENQELLAAIQSGRAPLSLLKVRHDQPVELRIAKRMNEKWVRQPPPPAGPFSGSGNRLGSVSPYPSSAAPSAAASMPGSFTSGYTSSTTSGATRTPSTTTTSANSNQGGSFEVDRTQPTTQVQIRLRDGERMVATFNHSHTVGDIRRYINASRPGQSESRYALQTTFPTKDLQDDTVTIKEAGLLGSVVVQRAL